MPKDLKIGFNHKSHFVVNPAMDETGCFFVNPLTYYGEEKCLDYVTEIMEQPIWDIEDAKRYIEALTICGMDYHFDDDANDVFRNFVLHYQNMNVWGCEMNERAQDMERLYLKTNKEFCPFRYASEFRNTFEKGTAQ
jgi:hypothetical protein